MVLIGVIQGNGSGVIKPVTRLICGVWKPASSEVSTHNCHDHDQDHDHDHDDLLLLQVLGMSVTTKECLAAALLLVLDQVSKHKINEMPGRGRS